MSYHLQITTDAEAGLVTLTINGHAVEIVEADIPQWKLDVLPPQLTIGGHHVRADESGTEWVRATASRKGMVRDNGEGQPFTQLYTPVVVGEAQTPIDRRHPDPEPEPAPVDGPAWVAGMYLPHDQLVDVLVPFVDELHDSPQGQAPQRVVDAANAVISLVRHGRPKTADADPGDIARDATPEEIAALAASIPHHDDADDSAVDGG